MGLQELSRSYDTLGLWQGSGANVQLLLFASKDMRRCVFLFLTLLHPEA